VLTLGLLALLVAPAPGVRMPPRRHLLLVVLAALAGAAIAALVTWLVVDVAYVFGISLTWVVRWAVGLGGAALAVAAVNLFRTRWWRKAVALAAAGLSFLCFFLATNVDFGQYPRLGDALGVTYAGEARLPASTADAVPLASWTAPAGLPERGTVGRVTIPATVSGFPARDAYVYLPPAAYAPNPPELPVVIALAGQPGEPADLFRAAQLDRLLDDIAARHDGIAPIVVVPDQLGDPTQNPMCVDGPFGDSATYLTVDVPAWIRARLPVSAHRTDWAIAGFSQGGTCAVQLGAGFPELFGSLLDISGEEAPILGSVEDTIERGFGGDEDAYRAATPRAVLAASAPYPDTVALFAAGENDRAYSASMRTVSAEAADAGMAVTTLVSPGTAHDWNTARYGFREGFEQLLPRWGIEG
jgi:enterochelin esterase-like enzyme